MEDGSHATSTSSEKSVKKTIKKAVKNPVATLLHEQLAGVASANSEKGEVGVQSTTESPSLMHKIVLPFVRFFQFLESLF